MYGNSQVVKYNLIFITYIMYKFNYNLYSSLYTNTEELGQDWFKSSTKKNTLKVSRSPVPHPDLYCNSFSYPVAPIVSSAWGIG